MASRYCWLRDHATITSHSVAGALCGAVAQTFSSAGSRLVSILVGVAHRCQLILASTLLVTSSVQFIVELVKGDILSAFVGSPAFADGCCFGFGRRVERIGRFIGQYGGTDGNGASCGGELNQIAWLDAGFFGDGPGDAEAEFVFYQNCHKSCF